MNIGTKAVWRIAPFRVLILAGLLATLSSGNSAALEITNCSGSMINVEYRQGSGSRSVHQTVSVSTGASKGIAAGSSLMGLKIYENGLVDTLRISVQKLNSNGKFSAVRMPNGRWQLVTGSAC